MFSLVLRLSFAGQGPSRTECGYPALSLPLSLTLTLHASGFPKPLQKVRFSVAREIWALIKTATGMQHFASVARLAQSVEHETLNLRVVGSSPTLVLSFGFLSLPNGLSVSSTTLDLSLLMQDMCGMHSVGILPPHSRGLYVAGLCGATWRRIVGLPSSNRRAFSPL